MADGDTEQFSLRWNNFHSNLSSGFHALLQGEDLVDVTLAAGGNFVQAHKIVLSVCSPYFKELFKVNPCKHPIVIMKDVGHKELISILEFMYRGEVNVRQEELASFLKTAESLQVKGLTGDDPGEQEDILPVQTSTSHSFVKNRSPRKTSDKVPQPVRQQEKPQVLSNARMSERELPTPPYKRMRSEGQAPAVVVKQQPPRSPAQVPTPPLPQKSSLPSSPLTLPDESSQGVEFVSSMTHPKSEPLDYESDVEELDDSADNSKSESFMQLLGGESSQSHQDASGMGLLSSLPGISQDPNISQEGGQGRPIFIDSGRAGGTYQLVINKFIYNKERSRGKKIFWRCSDRAKTGCPSRCITSTNEVVITCAEHNHNEHSQKIKHKLDKMMSLKQEPSYDIDTSALLDH